MEDHLTLEALARLVDEAATPEERTHLAGCAACAAQLEQFRDQSAALGRLPDVRPPRGDWAVLEARMASEGLIHPEPNIFQRMVSTPSWMRAAAAVVLFVGGIGVGTSVGGSAVAPQPASAGSPASFASLDVTSAASVDDAAALVRLKEREYRDALVQYAQLSGEDATVINPETRMATLDYAAVALQAGLQQAPADPVLNGLYTSILAERDNTLRQISSTTKYW